MGYTLAEIFFHIFFVTCFQIIFPDTFRILLRPVTNEQHLQVTAQFWATNHLYTSSHAYLTCEVNEWDQAIYMAPLKSEFLAVTYKQLS